MVVHDRKKYEIYENSTNEYTFHMTLQLKKLKKRDYGAYKCISKNSIGGSEGLIRIYGEFINRFSFNIMRIFEWTKNYQIYKNAFKIYEYIQNTRIWFLF